jgi:hypothetical protein
MEVNQVEDKSEIAYRCFVDTCRSPATRDIYIRALSFFMLYLKLPPGAYDKLLDKDPKLIQMGHIPTVISLGAKNLLNHLKG